MTALPFWLFSLENKRRCEESYCPVADYSPSDWAVAIAEECGEVARIVKRLRDGHFGIDTAKHELAKELADVVTYCDLLATRMGIDLGAAVAEKFNEVSLRVGNARRLPVQEPTE